MPPQTITTELYQPVDIAVAGTCQFANPFFADLHGVFTSRERWVFKNPFDRPALLHIKWEKRFL
jgi:hypothetical protein